ncbi:MAG: hypothetical protein JST11_28185 [Acidobacteria bacterium]|nr:hypothetical protein [Acidobacteriota bacterium]
MLKLLKDAKAALAMLNPEQVRRRAETPLQIGLVADSSGAYSEMEEFLAPPEMPHEERMERMAQIHRASDPEPPSSVDVVIYEPGLACPQGSYSFFRGRAEDTVAEILREKDDLALGLARQFPAFRGAVLERLVHEVSRENALFAVTTALPNVVPNLIELPWAFGEFASDTTFLTVNQMRMAFEIAGACGKPVGLVQQKFEMLGIAGGALGWRALARELVGHIPLGGGLIPKGAVAYAGTYLTGKGLERLHVLGERFNRDERKALYERALERGRHLVRELRAS